MNEQLPIPGFENYTIDKLGNVRNRTGSILKTWKNYKGYDHIKLSNNGIKKHISIHRLLGIVFLGVKENQLIDHINGIRDDNRLENLRVCNYSENMRNRKKSTRGYIHRKKENSSSYMAYININKKQYSKRFPYTEEGKQQALKWRVCMEIEYFKEFAPRINVKSRPSSHN